MHRHNRKKVYPTIRGGGILVEIDLGFIYIHIHSKIYPTKSINTRSVSSLCLKKRLLTEVDTTYDEVWQFICIYTNLRHRHLKTQVECKSKCKCSDEQKQFLYALFYSVYSLANKQCKGKGLSFELY